MDSNKKCRACSSENIVHFFDLGDQPYANALTKDCITTEHTYPLSLSFCKDCLLVQLNYTADPKELFSNYFWVTSTSSTAREYAEGFCEKTLARSTKNINYVLEIASNDGTFLRPFKDKGIEVLGVDPALNIVEQAEKSGIPTYCSFFSESVAKEIISQKGYPSIVLARNVLPHVANLHEFVKGLEICCGDTSLLVLEIHYSGKIIDEIHYDSIYHEHLCYFTFASLNNLLNKYNLYPFDIEFSPISGGSIVLYIKNKPTNKSSALVKFINKEEDNGYNTLQRWQDFANTSFMHRKLLNSIIDKEVNKNKKIIGYGASARSSTMLNFCGIGNQKIFKIADQNPLKQGLYTPGTKIEIIHPDAALEYNPDVILLLAWNFKNEIITLLREKYNYSGIVIIPLPFPPYSEEI